MGPLIPIASRAIASASSSVIQKIATRIGSAANPAAILAAMKNNPVTTVLVGAELFGPASDFVKTVVASHPEVSSLIEQIADIDYKPDTFSAVEDPKGLGQYKDEFDLIEHCTRALGGRDNLMRLRNMLKLSDDVFRLHEQVIQLGYRR